MPWCDGCDRFWNPNSLPADGHCPRCGRLVDPAAVARGRRGTAVAVEEREPKAPWHFKLLVVAITGYLGWRAVEGVAWVIERF